MPSKVPKTWANAPDQEAVARWTKGLRAIVAELEASFRIMPTRERNKRAKLPRNGVEAMKNVLKVAQREGYALGGIDPREVEDEYARAKRLRAIAREAADLKYVADTAAMALEGDVWSEVTMLYTVMNDVARRKSSVGDAIAVARDFFKKRRNHKPKKNNGSPSK